MEHVRSAILSTLWWYLPVKSVVRNRYLPPVILQRHLPGSQYSRFYLHRMKHIFSVAKPKICYVDIGLLWRRLRLFVLTEWWGLETVQLMFGGTMKGFWELKLKSGAPAWIPGGRAYWSLMRGRGGWFGRDVQDRDWTECSRWECLKSFCASWDRSACESRFRQAAAANRHFLFPTTRRGLRRQRALHFDTWVGLRG